MLFTKRKECGIVTHCEEATLHIDRLRGNGELTAVSSCNDKSLDGCMDAPIDVPLPMRSIPIYTCTAE